MNKINKPTSRAEEDRYCRTTGDLYHEKNPPPWDCPEGSHWRKTIFGDWFERRDDLPYSCDPSYERYWCM